MKNNLNSLVRKNFGLLLLLLISFFIYIPSLSSDFVFDDTPLIRDNPYIRDVSHVGRLFTKGVWENTALEIDDDPRYLPMVLAPMMLNHAIWGINPTGYHIYALLLHLAATCLVYVLVRRLTAGSAIAATLGAAIFALHPTRVESVAWIVGSIDPLLSIFLLGALLAHQSFVNSSGDKPQWHYLILSIFCFQLALWSKETAIAFPLILIAHDLIYQNKINRLATSLHIAIAASYLVVRSLVLGTSGKINPFDISQLQRAIDFALGYSELLIFPSQVPFYLKSPEHPVSSILGMVGALVIVVAIGFSWRAIGSGKRKNLLFALIWAAVFFWPAVMMMFYGDGFYYARWLYIPAIGVSVFLATLYAYITSTYPRFKIPVAVSCLLIVSCYGFLTWREIPSWRNDEAFYTKVVRHSPDGAAGYCGLGQLYFIRESYPASVKNYLSCMQNAKKPDIKVEALVKLGTIHGIANNFDASAKYLNEAISIAPGNSEGLAGLGNLSLMQGQIIQAISYYEKAIESRPDNYEASMNLAVAYDRVGQTERAEMIRRSIHQP